MAPIVGRVSTISEQSRLMLRSNFEMRSHDPKHRRSETWPFRVSYPPCVSDRTLHTPRDTLDSGIKLIPCRVSPCLTFSKFPKGETRIPVSPCLIVRKMRLGETHYRIRLSRVSHRVSRLGYRARATGRRTGARDESGVRNSGCRRGSYNLGPCRIALP